MFNRCVAHINLILFITSTSIHGSQKTKKLERQTTRSVYTCFIYIKIITTYS